MCSVHIFIYSDQREPNILNKHKVLENFNLHEADQLAIYTVLV